MGSTHGPRKGHGSRPLPHLASVAIALDVVAAEPGVAVGGHAGAVTAVHHPGICRHRLLSHSVQGDDFGLVPVPLVSAHVDIFTVVTATAASAASAANADPGVLGHVWAG